MELGPIQKKWIAYLRERPEEQGKYSLGYERKEKKYMCCLGAGAIIAGIGEWRGKMLIVEKEGSYNEASLEGENYKALGLRDEWGDPSPAGVLLGLAGCSTMNDREGTTWPQIADILEGHSDEYFTHAI